MQEAHHKYNGFNNYLRKEFGEKVWRITLDLGLSCPNVDGTVAKGGCYFCNDDHLLGKSWHKKQSLEYQVDFGLRYLKDRHNPKKYLAYFQNGSNTHAPVAELRPAYFKAINDSQIVGLIVSTRSDCLGDDVLDLLSEMNEKTYLWVELGLQSTHNHVLDKINRAHSFENYCEAVHKLAARQIKNCTHIILGMPDESKEEIMQGVHKLNALPIDGLKLHNMFVAKHTVLEKWYNEGSYRPYELQEYAEICVDYLEHLRPDIVIQRLNAHAPERLTAAPMWSINKWTTLNAVHEELLRRDTHQGRLYKNSMALTN